MNQDQKTKFRRFVQKINRDGSSNKEYLDSA